uniref:Uncharacterized protein n=1 Tax=Triticum urartu TaxID=4572 RepID=A0A8R7PJH5_TRIUA
MAGAMLSAWKPLTAFSDSRPASTRPSRGSSEPKSASTALAAAAAEAAEEPRPEPSGRPLARLSETPCERTPRALSAATAAMPAQLRSGSRERRSARRGKDGEVMPEMATVPAGSVGSSVAVTVSPRESEASATAQPRKSKPGPMFATVAGANAVTDLKAGGGSADAAAAETLSLLETRKESSVALRVEGKEDCAVAGDAAAAAAIAGVAGARVGGWGLGKRFGAPLIRFKGIL